MSVEKSALRRLLIAKRIEAFTASPNGGARLVAHFPAEISISDITIIGAYMPFRSEIDPLPLIRTLAKRGALTVMPRVNVLPCDAVAGEGDRAQRGGGGLLAKEGMAKVDRPLSLLRSQLPRKRGSTCLTFHLCDPDNPDHLQQNKWGIFEPNPDLPEVTPDILLVPLLGFDRSGNRLGYGKGYYDQAIANLDAITIGLAFAAQEVPEIPTQPHDQRLDWIITENEAYRTPS